MNSAKMVCCCEYDPPSLRCSLCNLGEHRDCTAPRSPAPYPADSSKGKESRVDIPKTPVLITACAVIVCIALFALVMLGLGWCIEQMWQLVF